MFDAAKVKNECVEWIRNWFHENGEGCNAVIGISGGKDSTVAAALCVEALGRERVYGIMMPNGTQSDLGDSYAVVNHLGISYMCANIGDAYLAVLRNAFYAPEDVTPDIRDTITISNLTTINLAPRLRMTTLYALSQSLNGRVVNTCNLSEDYIGFSTRWGDSVGDFAPLAHLTSDEVVAIGEVLDLPWYLVHKTPSDGLTGKSDEDNFGFSYAVLNKYIRTGICEDPVIKEKIDTMHKRNAFKLKPIPHFPYNVKVS